MLTGKHNSCSIDVHTSLYKICDAKLIQCRQKKSLHLYSKKKLYKKNPHKFITYCSRQKHCFRQTLNSFKNFKKLIVSWRGLFRYARPKFLFGIIPGGNNVAYLFS